MSIQTATNRFIVPPKSRFAELYQQLLSGVVDYERLGNTLIRLSEQARTLRQFDQLSEYALLLSNLPLKRYQTIGQYFLGLSLCRNGSGELDKAQAILENVASVAAPRYKAEAMISLSSIACIRHKSDDTLKYCAEIVKLEGVSIISAKAVTVAAILKGFEGYHKSALCDLENIYPLVRHAPPHIYFDYLNSLAVELAECGRFEEARNVSAISCSSPLVSVYPEWRETHDDISLRGQGPSRSTVSFAQRNTPQNVLRLPQRERSPVHAAYWTEITSLQQWKNKMVKEPNNSPRDNNSDDTEQDLVLQIMELVAKKRFSKKQLRELRDSINNKEPDEG